MKNNQKKVLFKEKNDYLSKTNNRDNILEIVCRNNDIKLLVEVLKNNKLYNFSKNDYELIVMTVCNTDDSSIINRFFSIYKTNLDKDYINILVNKLCELKNINVIIDIIENNREYLSDENIQNFITTIISTKDTSMILKLGCLNNTINTEKITKYFTTINDFNIIHYYLKNNRNLSNYEFNILLDSILSNKMLSTSSNLYKLVNDLDIENSISTKIVNYAINNDLYDGLVNISSTNKVNEADINKITNYVKTKESKDIYYYSLVCDRLIDTNYHELVLSLKDKKDIRYIYLFLKDNNEYLLEEDINLLKETILKSRNMKYVILCSIYIDNILLFDLFGNVNGLYLYIKNSNLFTERELFDIETKLFYNIKVNNKKIESNILELSKNK